MGLFSWKKKEKTDQLSEVEQKNVVEPPVNESDNTEVVAAIALALRLYSSTTRDLEDAIITIQKIMKPYSPWNSKIYNLKQMPHRTPRRILK